MAGGTKSQTQRYQKGTRFLESFKNYTVGENALAHANISSRIGSLKF